VAATLDELTIADSGEAWARCGFRVEDGECAVGSARFRFSEGAGLGRGLTGWSLRGLASTELDGLPTGRSDRPERPEAPPHPNGVSGLDHVVAISPDLDRTIASLEAAGLDLRRVREEPTPAGAPRQAFFRLGAAILEVVQEPPEAVERGGGVGRPAFFWGLAFLAPDLEATARFLGEAAGEVRDAVQPGRSILTLRRSAGLAVPVAVLSSPG
jgi:catechol 2,3-dioxygenase-like lactoylglutathione lyase family enzyme